MNQLIKQQNKKGFTLIELIVVIVIIGILAAIVIPRLTGFQATAKIGADIATGKTIATAAAAMQAQNLDPNGVISTASAIVTNYLQSVPVAQVATGPFTVNVTASTGAISVSTSSGNVFPDHTGSYAGH